MPTIRLLALAAAALPLVALLLATVPAIAGESIRPKPGWVSVSSGIHLDRWGGTGSDGNGLGWKARNRLYNPPQTLTVLNFGAGLAFGRTAGLSLSVPIFHNTIDPYVSAFGGNVPGQKASGIGDIELAMPLRFAAFGVQASLSAPWAYEPGFLKPWKGFGVYRAGFGGSWSARRHLLWASFNMVVHQPEGDAPALVEPLDHSLKGGYAWKHRLSRRLHAKAAADLSFTSFSWSGDDPQRNYSIDPRAGLAFTPASGHEISVAASATLYSFQGGSRTYHTYASRRTSLTLYYGRYF